MKIQRPTCILLGLAAVAAVGLLWWWIARGGQGADLVTVSPPVLQAGAPQPVASVEPAPRAAAPVAVPEPETQNPKPETAAAPAAPASSVQPSSVMSAVPDTSAPAAAIDEVAATERMYLAHAPLRAAEVADPDSESNRRILQTMVEKALRASATAPTANAAH